MSLLPGGTFEMGEDGDTVTVRSFCLDRTEITVQTYAGCVQGGSCRAPTEGNLCVYGELGRENHPVNCVTWLEAARFCKALGKRLPSEEEWEWAARGRQRAWSYPFGDEIRNNQVCWRGMDCIRWGRRGPSPDAHMWTCRVGEHRAGDSPDGIHDLAGNVSEWTSSGDEEGRIIRGGSFNSNDAANLTASYRLELAPEAKKGSVGFRCAASPIK
jgi:formylglycine-generating enzyme required for sulfatase activity